MLLIRSSINSKLNLARLNYVKSLNVQRVATAGAHFENEATKAFWEKNKQLNRPISPYVHYQPQLTWLLSLTHRATGLGLSGGLYAFGISQLLVNNNWANQLTSLQAFCPNTFLAAKFLIVSSFYFHLFNGVRHLSWDLGKGFQLKQLYASGYAVLILSAVLSAITMYNL